MSCERPHLAVSLGKFDGKQKIKFLGRLDWNIKKAEQRYGYENLLMLPCGKCPSCKAAHQKMWAIRCSLESLYYKENCMVTLTYDNEHLPVDYKLHKEHLQEFIKKLRNHGLKIRYYGCGEYGSSVEHLHRPHYHIILFGYWPEDAKFDIKSSKGFPIYSSEFLTKVWNKGIVSVSEMTSGTAYYTAGYVEKKMGIGEFSLMSTKPGIGERYFREHLMEIYKYDNVVGSFGVGSVPRYCDKLADYSWMDIEDIKNYRKKKANDSVIQIMNDYTIQVKDEAVGYTGRQMRDKLQRRKRL